MPGIERLVRSSILIIFILFSNFYSQIHPDRKIDSLFALGINSISSYEYNEARRLINIFKETYPELPFGEILDVSSRSNKYVDLLEVEQLPTVKGLLDSALEKSEMLLEKDPEDLWNNYYYALVHAYLAYFEVETDNLASAFINGLTAVQYYQRCLKIDPEFSEAKVGIGTYIYWKSKKSDFLNWLPFVEDQREEGIKLIESGLKKKFFNNSPLAAHTLFWIYIEETDYDSALNLIMDYLNRFPKSRLLKMDYAHLLKQINKDGAVSVYRELFEEYNVEGKNAAPKQIIILHKIAITQHEMGKDEEALQTCNEIFDSFEITDEMKSRLGDRYEKLVEFKSYLASLTN